MIIALEQVLPLTLAPDAQDTTIFVRIDVTQEFKSAALLSIKNLALTPILHYPGHDIHPARLSHKVIEELVERHLLLAQQLLDLGFDHMVIAADNDGALQKILSPRSSSLSLEQRMAPLLEVFKSLLSISPQTMVLLTVEELSPGGLDATDGIAVARALASLGLKEIIATAGTKDFWPLYDRRTTTKKHPEQDDFYSHEPSLASAAWLTHNTHLKVWCLAYLDDPIKARAIAQDLGLVGIINKASVGI